MTKGVSSISSRLVELPRPMRWLIVVVVGTVLFLLWDSTIRPLNDELRDEADRIEQRVATVRNAAGLNRQLQNLEEAVASIGEVDLPGNEQNATTELQTVVNKVLKEYPRISKDSFSARPEGKLRRGALNEIARGRRIETIRGDLSFEGTPEETAAIIATLESTAAVERFTSVQLNRIGGGKLRVRLSLEAWVLGSE